MERIFGRRIAASVYNPAKGWFATANEMNLPVDYPAEQRKIAFEWANRSRIDRIESVLGSTPKVGIEDSMRLQTDAHDVLSGKLIALLGTLSSSNPLVSRSIELLKAWDHNETTTRLGPFKTRSILRLLSPTSPRARGGMEPGDPPEISASAPYAFATGVLTFHPFCEISALVA